LKHFFKGLGRGALWALLYECTNKSCYFYMLCGPFLRNVSTSPVIVLQDVVNTSLWNTSTILVIDLQDVVDTLLYGTHPQYLL